MFNTTDIHIYRKIFVCFFSGNKSFIILIIDISEEVPGRTCPLRHRICLTLCRCAAARACRVYPPVNVRKRRLSGASRLIALYLRQGKRKLILRNRYISALRTVDDRDRLSPITLTGEYPVTEFIIHRLFTDTHFFDDDRGFLLKDCGFHSIPLSGIDHGAAGLCIGLSHVFNFFSVLRNDLNDRNVEFSCKLKVTVIMGRNTHDRSGTVIRQYIVRQPDRNLCAV